jgi:hypothetical protein
LVNIVLRKTIDDLVHVGVTDKLAAKGWLEADHVGFYSKWEIVNFSSLYFFSNDRHLLGYNLLVFQSEEFAILSFVIKLTIVGVGESVRRTVGMTTLAFETYKTDFGATGFATGCHI